MMNSGLCLKSRIAWETVKRFLEKVLVLKRKMERKGRKDFRSYPSSSVIQLRLRWTRLSI